MKKLEDIPKNNPFTVPEGYFDKLPGMIQARIEAGKAKVPVPYLRYALQYALPVVVLTLAAVLYLQPKNTHGYDDILATVSTEQLAVYLADTDITTDEIVTEGGLDDESAEAIEAEVFTDIDLNALELELEL